MEDSKIIEKLAEDAEFEEEQEEQEEQEQETVSDEAVIAALNAPSEAVQAALQKMVNEAVKRVLAKKPPRRNTVHVDPITREQFQNMSYAERERLYESNRPLYDRLKNK